MTTAVVRLPALTCAEGERATPAPTPSTAPATCAVSASMSHATAGDCVTLDNAHSQHWRAAAEAETATTMQGGTAATPRSMEAQLETTSELLPSANSTASDSPAAAQHTAFGDCGVSGAQASGPHAHVQHGGRLPSQVALAAGSPTRLPAPRRTPTSAHSATPSGQQQQPALLSSVQHAASQQHNIVRRASPVEPVVTGYEHAALGPISPADERASDRAPPAGPVPLVLEVASTEDAGSSMHGRCGPDVEASSGITHVAAGAGQQRDSADSAASGAEADQHLQLSGEASNPLTMAAQSKAWGGGTFGSLAKDPGCYVAHYTVC